MTKFAAVFCALALAGLGCQKADNQKNQKPAGQTGSGSGSAGATVTATPPKGPKVPQVAPPFDVKTVAADATKTASGLAYKKITALDTGESPGPNDIAMVQYVGWNQAGETFYSTRTRGAPVPMNMTSTIPGLAEALKLMKKGEKWMLWVPPEIGYRSPPPAGKAEMLAYEMELVDIQAAPKVPENVAAAPADAKTTKSGAKFVVLTPGTGTAKLRYFDNASFHITAWDPQGKMLESTEMRKRPLMAPPFRKPQGLQEILEGMVVGQRVRAWVPNAQLGNLRAEAPQTEGTTYEIEILEITPQQPPPPVPSDVAAAPADALKSPKGVPYKVLKAGNGKVMPSGADTVKVHYTGWSTDGRMFDSSIVRAEAAEFPLNAVIPGWSDGLQTMSVGGKTRFWIPEELAYKGAPGKPAGMLVFDVELLEIVKAPEPPKTPDDVAAPPADAQKTAKGVSYKVLTPGKGGAKPTPTDTVKVHYAGWTTDGKMFDTSVTRGKPAEFPLNGVIPGWTDGLQVMSVGEKTRFWIPVEMAYNNQPGRPAGMLVFDVELLEIKPQK